MALGVTAVKLPTNCPPAHDRRSVPALTAGPAHLMGRVGLFLLTLGVVPASVLAADPFDGITLTVSRGAQPGEIALQWTGGEPNFKVYRATSASGVVDPAHQLGESAVRSWVDLPTTGGVLYYVVTSPCVYNPPEVCNGVDDDCDGTVDGSGSEASCGLANALAQCAGGACAIASCTPTHGDCDGSAADGCETPLDTVNDCGVCGNVCPAGGSCAGDQCLCPMGQVPSPTGCVNVATRTVLSVGASGGCAVLSNGSVACWGRNHYGELGLDAPDNLTHLPSRVVSLFGAVSVGIRNTFACALVIGGNVKCWGSNGLGELGDETTNPRSFPASVHGPAPGQILAGATALSVGDNHSCIVDNLGVVWCWGANSSGQLGDGTAIRRSIAAPILNPSGSRYVSVAAGAKHTCALTTNGDVYCWGANSHGQLNGGQDGIGNPLFAQAGTWTPIRISSLSNVRAISAGSRHNCALLANGTETCWGEMELMATHPQPTLKNLVAVAAGGGQSCALDAGGQVHCWGSNLDFQIGSLAVAQDGVNPTVLTAPASMAVSNVVAVATGLRTTCVATAGGLAQCWGGNFAGEAGNGLSRGSGDSRDMPNWIVDAARPYTLLLPGTVASPTQGSGGAP
jgi:alpha-tubulin suppressor-like RCC1 family protein